MAERVVHKLIDDLDGSEISEGDGERIDFTVRGVRYRIDLSSTNAAQFDRALAPFVEAAEQLRTASRKQFAISDPPRRREQSAVRKWARTHGYDVAARGRVRTEILQAFEAAH